MKTATPGVYRRGSRYVVRFRDPQGRARKRSARTLAEARALRAQLTADVVRGEYRQLSRVRFDEHAREWVETFRGRTNRGITEHTRADYRRRLEQDAIPFFGRTLLAEIAPGDVKRFAAHVAARGVSPNTVRLALAPLKALLADAHEEGLIRSNPAAGLRGLVPRRELDPDELDEDGETRALSEAELDALLAALPPEWRLFHRFLAETGLRVGEAVELRWRDVDGRWLRVRRAFYRGTVGPPKTRAGRRRVPLSPSLAADLWRLRKLERGGDDDLVFTSARGRRIDQPNLMVRVLKPAARAAGVDDWPGFHTLRHTCASRLFRAGWNAKQVCRLLGHTDPAFTLRRYVHLMDEDLPEVPFPTPAAGEEAAAAPTRAAAEAAS